MKRLLTIIALWAAGAALLACVCVQAGCGTTTRDLLDGAYRGGVVARKATEGDTLCRPVLERCKADKLCPCPALDRCQDVQPTLLGAARQLQRLVLAGWQAQALGEDVTAREKLNAALAVLVQLRASLADWGVEVPL